jgi:hypothetical protein
MWPFAEEKGNWRTTMARIRVGDVEIDGRDVAIRGTSRPGIQPSVTGSSLDAGMLRFLRRLPFQPNALGRVGAVLVLAGATAVGLVFGYSAHPGWLVLAGISLSAGFGLLGAGVAKHYAMRKPEWTHLAVLGPRAREYLAAMLQLLGQDDGRQTVAWIMARTGWSEVIVLHALALLIARDQVSEQYDPQAKATYYVATHAFLPYDLDSRLRDLEP